MLKSTIVSEDFCIIVKLRDEQWLAFMREDDERCITGGSLLEDLQQYECYRIEYGNQFGKCIYFSLTTAHKHTHKEIVNTIRRHVEQYSELTDQACRAIGR